MFTKSSQDSEGKVPLGVVFMTLGIMILLIVIGVWAIAPQTMPQPVYVLIAPYLPQTAVSLPTSVPVAALPTTASLPSTNTDFSSLVDPITPLPTPLTITDPTLGLPNRIVIPAIKLDAPVIEVGVEPVYANGETYYQWLVPNAFEAGWHEASARLGQPGNTVLNGHHNVHGEVFRDLVDLSEGDEIILYDNQEKHIYRITDVELLPERDQPLEVRLQNAQWIAPTEDERITLVTCWPYTDNTHRLVVVAHPITGQTSQKNN